MLLPWFPERRLARHIARPVVNLVCIAVGIVIGLAPAGVVGCTGINSEPKTAQGATQTHATTDSDTALIQSNDTVTKNYATDIWIARIMTVGGLVVAIVIIVAVVWLIRDKRIKVAREVAVKVGCEMPQHRSKAE